MRMVSRPAIQSSCYLPSSILTFHLKLTIIHMVLTSFHTSYPIYLKTLHPVTIMFLFPILSPHLNLSPSTWPNPFSNIGPSSHITLYCQSTIGTFTCSISSLTVEVFLTLSWDDHRPPDCQDPKMKLCIILSWPRGLSGLHISFNAGLGNDKA